MTEILEPHEIGDFEFLLKSLPGSNGKAIFSKEEFAAELANAVNQQKASEYLAKIAANPENLDPGTTAIRVGSHHLKLKKLVQSAVASAFFLGLSAFEPTKITALAGVERGLEFVKTVGESLEELKPTDILLYDIIVEIQAQNYVPHIKPGHPQGTETDIQNAILARGFSIPQDFKASLRRLLSKQAIKPEPEDSDDPIYLAVF
jgi:hypothetical protein